MALNESMAQLAMEDKSKRDEQTALVAPTAIGVFSTQALNKLVAAYNKARILFGLKDEYPTFTSNLKQLPVDFVKLLLMISSASQDAATAEAIKPELVFDLSSIKKDTDLLIVAAKLIELAKSKDFKTFLSEAPVEEEATNAEEYKDDASESEANAPMTNDQFLDLISTKIK